jgi:hypothetical protein
MKPSEKIALITSETTNRNDMASKVIAPTMGLMTALQQNELAERKERLKNETPAQPSNIRQISNVAPADVLAGLQALFSFQEISAPPPKQLKAEELDETPFVKD